MAGRQGPSRRRRAQAVDPGPIAVFATRAEAAAALARAGSAITLVSAPGLAQAAGPAWVTQVIATLRLDHPDVAVRLVLDIGDDAALAHRLLAEGGEVVFNGSKTLRDKLVAIARGRVWSGIAPGGRLR